MRTQFFSRNVWIGVLIGLVLALGVQGTVEALTLKISSGDLVTVAPNQQFTLRFSVVGLKSPVAVNERTSRASATDIQYADETRTRSDVAVSRIVDDGYSPGDTHYYTTTAAVDTSTVTGLAITTNTRNWGISGTNDAELPAGRTWTAGRATDLQYASGGRTRSDVAVSRTVDADSGDIGYDDGDTHYYTTTAAVDTSTVTGLAITTNTRNWVTESAAYYYNDESVSITSTPTLMKGNTAVSGDMALKESAEESDERLSGSVTLTGRHGTAGMYNIIITDDTAPADIDGTPPSPRASITFTVYVVNSRAPASVTSLTLNVDAENYKTNGDDHEDQIIDASEATSADDYRIEYSVVEGPGRLYVQRRESLTAPIRKSSPLRTLETSNAAEVRLDMNGGTNKVQAKAARLPSTTGIFIFGDPTVTIVSGNPQEGVAGGRLELPLVVKVTDGKNRPISGLAAVFSIPAAPSNESAMFIPFPGTTVYTTESNQRIFAPGYSIHKRENATSTRPAPPPDDSDHSIAVETDPRGEAKTYFKLGALTDQTVEVTAGGAPLISPSAFTLEIGSTSSRPTLSILSGNNQRTDEDGEIDTPLVVVVRQGGHLLPNQLVTFRVTRGTLVGDKAYDSTTNPPTTSTPGNAKRVYDITNSSGEAQVTYFQDPGEGSDTVRATIGVGDYEDTDFQRRVTFNINGGGSPREPAREPESPPTATGSLTIGVTGEGATRSVTVTSVSAAGTPTAIPVVLTGNALGGSTEFVTTGTATEITVPTEPGSYALTATASVAGYAPTTETITVAGPTSLGTISITPIGQPTNGLQTFSIRVRDTDGDPISGALTVTVRGSGFTTRSVPTANGSGAVSITLPTTAGSYTLTASAEDYTSGTTPVRIAGTDTGTGTGAGTGTGTGSTPPPTVEETPPEPARVNIVGPSQREGTANSELEAALIVQVLDADGDAVEDARVIFRVRKGQGRLSQRGNGRAIAVQTDEDGYGRAAYTPMSASSTVEAEVRGVSRTVTFTITASGGSTTPTTRDTGTGTTPSTITPVVHVKAASRPSMLWVDDGAIYALVGASPQRFAPSVENALNIAIADTKVYWTEQTGESAGTINSANADGSGVKELKSIQAVPIGIAVDTANSLLYWTNSRGRIQRLNTDGSGRVENVLQNLERPMDLALAGGNAYWTQANGSVRFVNLRGQKQIRNISTGTDAAISLAIGSGKVYWTEQTGESAGTINSANLNGNGATQLASIRAVPVGIGVDGSRSKLYWTNSRGRIQSSDLNGKKIQNVVDGLGMPGDMVLSNSIKAPAAEATTPTTRTTASTSKYDVNGDGSVDSKDVTALIDAISLGVTANKYDVNGDGKVDILDARAVNANLDAGAAAAPMLVGMKLSAVQIERLQEQIDLLIATGDRSPAAMRTLIYLQQLIVMARPEKTQLLANYPNPFNPETWIPYELATDTDVRITIYNAQGVVIRTLQLGQQSAGYYTDRERAAYWDGRNVLGEQVASGIYFYQLETDDMSSLRKMVILK